MHFGLGLEFPTIFKIALNILLSFQTMCLREVVWVALIIIIAKCQPVLKHVDYSLCPAYQISQDLVLYVKISKHSHFKGMQTCSHS